jgi:phosphotransacetylase
MAASPQGSRSGRGRTGADDEDAVAGHIRDQVLRWSVLVSGHRPVVVFADGDDPRVASAAAWLAANTSVRPVLLTRRSENVRHGVQRWSLEALSADPEVRAALRTRANGVRRDREEAEALAHDPVYVAPALVTCGRADAAVAGATRTTGDVIRAAISVIGLAPAVPTISSSFVFVLRDGRRLAYGDCAVLPAPDEEQLAQVAVATARTFHELVGQDPVVAMLSFSTMGSAQHPEVDTVRAATRIARVLQPGLCIDGELQFDAALLESVGSSKAAGSPVAGRANVLVFPNLSAGNIGYKITERLAGAAAVGPILQGLAAPMNDLSRGCSSRDVIAVALLSAVQAMYADVRAGRCGAAHGPAARVSAATV